MAQEHSEALGSDSRLATSVGTAVEAGQLGRPAARILMLVPSPPPLGGVEAAYQMLLPHLGGEFNDLTVCSSSVRLTNFSRGKFDWAGVAATVRMLVRLWKALVFFRPDAILMTLSISPTGLMKEGAAIALARLWGSQVVVHYHQGELLARVLTGGSWWLRAWLKALLSQVRFVLVLGEGIGKALVEAGMDSRRVRVLHNCIDLDAVTPKDWGAAEAHNEVRLVFLGDVSFRKGFPDLADALAVVREKNPSVVLVVAGEVVPPAAESFLRRDFLTPDVQLRFDRAGDRIREALEAGASAGICYMGSVRGEHKWQLLRDSDVLVLPSYAEGLPMSILEAMATGLAVIATSVGAVTDAVIDGETGYVVPPGGVALLADRLGKLAADVHLRRRMGEAGRHRIERVFSGPVVGTRFGSLMREAAARARPPQRKVW